MQYTTYLLLAVVIIETFDSKFMFLKLVQRHKHGNENNYEKVIISSDIIDKLIYFMI